MVLDIQTVHHILKNTAVQNVNKPFVYITDLTSTLRYMTVYIVKIKIHENITEEFSYVEPKSYDMPGKNVVFPEN
jgi:hypothetical protein